MSNIECLIFDLDGTLYDINNGYLQVIRDNIFSMMVKKGYATNKQEAELLWKPLFKQYNQSFKGLNAGGYHFTNDEYWKEHRSGMEHFFKPDEQLRQLLLNLSYKKVIFTNCREKEAIEILKLLNIYDCFDKIYGADFMGDVCKPQKESFELVLQDLGINSENILYFEDSVKNLIAAHQLNMKCVLIYSNTAQEEGSIITILDETRKIGSIEGVSMPIIVLDTLNDGGVQLKQALPELF